MFNPDSRYICVSDYPSDVLIILHVLLGLGFSPTPSHPLHAFATAFFSQSLGDSIHENQFSAWMLINRAFIKWQASRCSPKILNVLCLHYKLLTDCVKGRSVFLSRVAVQPLDWTKLQTTSYETQYSGALLQWYFTHGFQQSPSSTTRCHLISRTINFRKQAWENSTLRCDHGVALRLQHREFFFHFAIR